MRAVYIVHEPRANDLLDTTNQLNCIITLQPTSSCLASVSAPRASLKLPLYTQKGTKRHRLKENKPPDYSTNL